MSDIFEHKRESVFRSKFSEDIFIQKYKHDGCETWAKLSKTLVQDVCNTDRTKGVLSDEELDRLTKYHSEMKFIAGGRYLYYAGRPNKFFNNCFLLKAEEDTRQDWADLSWKSESCLLTGGGIGIDYSVYRPRGSIIGRTGGYASGPISKMEMINEIGRRVMQGGSRRSAIYASLSVDHPDVYEFLTIKDWHNIIVAGTGGKSVADLKESDFNYAAPLDMTNISVNYSTNWLLNYWKTGQVGDVFYKNVEQALKTAEPGFSFNFFDKENETLRNACWTGDSLLLTKEGYLPIGSLVGKEVEIWNGEQWSLVKPFSTGVNEIVKITLTDGSVLCCTPYHKFLTINNFDNENITRVSAENLSVGTKLAKFNMPVVEVGEEYPVDAYSQGFYAGDGNNGYKFSWLYGEKIKCSERLIGELGSYDKTRDSTTWKHGEMLDKFFVPVKGSLEYCINWLAGLLDADGTVTKDKNGNGVQIASINHDFLLDVKLMLSRLGVRAKVVSGSSEGYREITNQQGTTGTYLCKETKRLLIGNTDTYHLLNNLNLKLNRLKLGALKPQRDARQYVRVKSIEFTGIEEETFCVTEPKANRMTVAGVVTGNCTEVSSADDSDVCNLGSINMGRVESIEEFLDIVNLATKFLICGTLRAELPYEKIYDIREKNRRLGLGLMGVHEWLIKRGYRYEVTEELHRWLSIYKSISRATADRFSDKLGISRPVACRAIAPTGSIGILAGTTTGIEPLFAVAYKRRYLKGSEWHYQYVVDGSAKELINHYGVNPDCIESAIDLAEDYERRIAFQADIQDYVDMSISSTINLPEWGSEHNNESTVKPFSETLAKYAHRLRGFTCYPNGARGGQPLTSVPYKEAVERQGKEYKEEYTDICSLTGGGTCGI